MRYIIILALVCVLAFLDNVQAQCCRESMVISYGYSRQTRRPTCAAAGGRGLGSSCTITICADGRAKQGYYCGRGPCNIFGCNCDGGCIPGNWQQSFTERNRHLGASVLHARYI